ncbi:hypothetical protein SAMN05216203_1619 [Marinobacter daqiaonensis]|uniref:Beta-barrel porin 2 n=1 Tax=Marinobacter daqiaonensis TaxID=650891 RepID=A0A1I6HWY1_9GAMM|nr:hypothetical protein [Marinobacter daqiaonensis]SFR58927.1 hypothetical protein SAMN05216203_1619 [Marinobacter daqiaonensis]
MEEVRCPRFFPRGVAVFLFPLVIPMVGLQAAESSFTATTTLFSDVTHTRGETDDDTRGGVGASGDLGAQFQSGAHNLNARYGATVETERSSLGPRDDNAVRFRGSSRYSFFEPGNRFDFNAGHSARSVRNDTGFSLDPAAYSTQNAVNAGAGLWFYPGKLTSLRVSGQGGKTWETDNVEEGRSANASAAIQRQVSERSTLSLTGGRSWEEQDESEDVTLDTASLGLDTRLENGAFSLSAGVSRAETDSFENDAVIGSVSRNWRTDLTNTRFGYDRSQSSYLLDLVLSPITKFGIEDEFSVRVQGVTVTDALSLVHTTRRICSLCTLNLVVRGAREEAAESGNETWEYLAGTRLDLAVDQARTVSLDYSWQGDAFTERSSIDDEIHRFSVIYSEQLTELATWGASFDTAFTRGVTDREQYRARVFITLGWEGLEREW